MLGVLVACSASMWITRERLLGHFFYAFVGVVVTAAFGYFKGGVAEAEISDTDFAAEPVAAAAPTSTSTSSMLTYEVLEAVSKKLWKPALGVVLMMFMEAVNEATYRGVGGIRLTRVLSLASFRETLRAIAQGRPMPAPPPTLEEEAQTAAAVDADYANLMAAKRRLKKLRVDHLVYGVPGTLAEAMKSFEERTGVAPKLGGTHGGLGTHNALVSLGHGAYFEVLCRDPAQPSPPKLWMGMESLGNSPTMLTWATDRASSMSDTVDTARAAGKPTTQRLLQPCGCARPPSSSCPRQACRD